MITTAITYTDNLLFENKICIMLKMNSSLLKVPLSVKEYKSNFKILNYFLP